MPKNSSPKKKQKKQIKKQLVFYCTCCAAMILLFLSFNNLGSLSYSRVLGAEDVVQDENVSNKISFWEDFLAKNPTYFDGWLELSYLMGSIGEKQMAEIALNKAKEINPNSEKLKNLEVSGNN